jgi:hypothetical protein
MRCYYVLVHGRFHWNAAPTSDDVSQPRGFYCDRYVLASDEECAIQIAFGQVRANLYSDSRWLSDGSATLDLEAEEIFKAPIYRLLKADNRGHTFYEQD